MATELHEFFTETIPPGTHTTVLIRLINGISTRPKSVESFIRLVLTRASSADLVFQYNDVFDAIRPNKLYPYRGMGSLAVFDALTMLDHLAGIHPDADTARIVEIWDYLEQNPQALGEWTDNRDDIPPEGATQATETQTTLG